MEVGGGSLHRGRFPPPTSNLPPEESHPLDDAAPTPDVKFTIPRGAEPSACKGCGQQIYFVRTREGGSMPVDPDGAPHWASCAKADEFRKPKGKKQSAAAAA